jgi:hypothetical protein
MNEVDKRPTTTYQSEEFIIANTSKRDIREVEVGGKKIDLYSSGATTYDPVLAREIKDKYKDDPNIIVINKPHVRPDGYGKTHHTVPALPWKDDKLDEN